MNKPAVLATAILIALNSVPSDDETRREPASFSLEPLKDRLFRPEEPELPKIDTNFELTDALEDGHA